MLKDQIYERQPDGRFHTKHFQVKTLKDFLPFPRFGERQEWEYLDKRVRQIIQEEALKYRGAEYPMLKASDFMEYFKSGSRAAYEDGYFFRRHMLSALVLDYCIRPEAEEMRQILDGIWCICEETSWAVPAHNFIYEPEPVNGERTLPDDSMACLDIFTGETGMLLSMTCYLLQEELDRIEPLVCQRIRAEVERRITVPFLTRYDYWWMGYSDRRDINNWGPWCVMNCVMCILLCEEKEQRRRRGIVRAMDMMDYYLEGIGEDGGCDEGATYWGRACGMLLEGLNLIYEATCGEVTGYGQRKLVQFTDYIRKMYIADNYVVNFADGSARCSPAAEIIYTAGEHMEVSGLKEFGAYCYVSQLEQGIFPVFSLSRAMASIGQHQKMVRAARGGEMLDKDSYIESLEIMTARQSNSPGDGFFLCAKGGKNDDSHNHNDVGNVICFYGGAPVLIDVGVEEYTREHFGSKRYEIWTMRSEYHNLPTIDGMCQKPGKEYRAAECRHWYDGNVSRLECDILPAYGESDGIRFYKRSCTLNREKEQVEILDRWDSQGRGGVQFHFMTPCQTRVEDFGIVFHSDAGDVIMKIRTSDYEIREDTIELTDKKLRAAWKDRLFRLTLEPKKQESRHRFLLARLPSL